MHFKDHYPCFLHNSFHLLVTFSDTTTWFPKGWDNKLCSTLQGNGDTEYLQVLAFTYGMFPSPYVCTIGFQHVKHLMCLNETIGSRSWKSKHKQLLFCQASLHIYLSVLFAFKDPSLFPRKWPAKFAWDCLSILLSPVSGPFKTKQSSFGHLSCIWISLLKSPPRI